MSDGFNTMNNVNQNQLKGENMQQPLITNYQNPQVNIPQQPTYYQEQQIPTYNEINPHQPMYQQQVPMYNNFPPQQTYGQPIITTQQPMYQTPQQQIYQPTQYQPVYQPPQPTNNIVVVQQVLPQNISSQYETSKPTIIYIHNENDGYPRLEKIMAVIILLVNIFLPGVGTIIMGCVGRNAEGWICIGICQLFLAVILIGWIWAIITGLMCLKYSV